MFLLKTSCTAFTTKQTAYYSKQAKTMLDYLYRIKKKKRVKPFMFSFFQSINNTVSYAVSLLIQTERKSSVYAVPSALQPVYKIPLGALKEFYCLSVVSLKFLVRSVDFMGVGRRSFCFFFCRQKKKDKKCNRKAVSAFNYN